MTARDRGPKRAQVAKTGKELERRVADAYRAMGARKVAHDVELGGNQIDVYVELETPGRLLHRIAVEAKDWASMVGIDVVNKFAVIVNLLRGKGLIDEGIIVSAAGFSKQARTAARDYSIQLLEPADLDAMVAEVQATKPTTSPPPAIPAAPPTPQLAEGGEEDEQPSPAEVVTPDKHDYDAFISYNHCDKKWVQGWLLPRLEKTGLRMCIDFRDFKPGLPTLVNMENAVERSRKTLIVLTPDWVESEWTTFEGLLIQADDPAGRRARMIPLLLKPCEPPRRIAILDYVDFTEVAEVEFQLQRLVAAIEGPEVPRAVRDRRIDAAVPSCAEVGQHVDLLVQVRFPDSPLLGIRDWPIRHEPASIDQASEVIALRFPVDDRTGRPGAAHLRIEVVAPDFAMEDTTPKLVEVPPDQYSTCVSFLLTPRSSGCCRINVVIYSVDDTYIATVPIETIVGDTVTPPIATVATLVVLVVVLPPCDVVTTEGARKSEISDEPVKAAHWKELPSQGWRIARLASWLSRALRDPLCQSITAVLALLIAVGTWFWPDIGPLLFPERPAVTPTVDGNEVVIEIDGSVKDAGDDRCQEVVCQSSFRIEAKVLDLRGVRLQPDDFSYNWHFNPPDPHNLDRLDSKNYAINYSAPCDRDSQMVTIEVLRNGRTLGVRTICFNIERPP